MHGCIFLGCALQHFCFLEKNKIQQKMYIKNKNKVKKDMGFVTNN